LTANYQTFMASASCFKGCFAPSQAQTGGMERICGFWIVEIEIRAFNGRRKTEEDRRWRGT
jgi:hypothetical protein